VTGLYFLAAGQSSRNRDKSLDRGLSSKQVSNLLSDEARSIFLDGLGDNDVVYAWGANRVGKLTKLSTGDFVVDVKNKQVVQVFQFLCWVQTRDSNLQNQIGWDSEKPKEKRRPFKIVYFLIKPMSTIRTDKAYFQKAFAQEANQNWLVGQRWFSPREIEEAMRRTNTESIEELLGLNLDSRTTPSVVEEPSPKPIQEDIPSICPEWLAEVVCQITELRSDPQHQERDHEDLVSRFFEKLGYRRGVDIKYRRGRVDILIQRDSKPLIVIEVKRDWSLSSKSRDYIQQAFNYALENGSRYVAVTNGDRYLIFDRSQGLSYEDHLVCEFQLTELKPDCIKAIEKLKPGNLGCV
jgi:hypothetical protein